MHVILAAASPSSFYHESSFGRALRLPPDDEDGEAQCQREDDNEQQAPQLSLTEGVRGLGQQHA